MNRLTTSLACIATAAAAGLSSMASAVGFTGNVFIAGVSRIVTTGVNQSASVANLPALPIQVKLASGAIEAPAFVVTGAATATASGSCYRIHATIVGPDRFRLIIAHNGSSTGAVRQVALGGGTQKIVFDRRSPAPGTSLSSTGRDVTPTGGSGSFTFNAQWTNPIQLGAAPPLGDVYNRILFNFDEAIVVQNYVQVEFDIDEVM